jgi:hypothetical protein
MVLNVIKGAYPSLIQISKDLPLSADETITVERGSLLYETADNEWRVASGATAAGNATTPGAFVYFALQAEDDLTAGMAGGVPTTGGDPKLSGLACSPTIEVETDMFDSGETYAVGSYCKVGTNGKLAPHTNHATAVLQVTKAAYVRWVNNAPAVAGWRTGNNVTVIRGRTMYIPNLTTA